MANDSLKIIHFNTQGFQNKVDRINKFVKLHNPDILVITEHFQKNKNDLEKVNGYRIINSFCRKHNERGGVAIWAKDEIPCRPRQDLDKHRREREFELVSVSVGDDLVITGAYRPPDTSIADFHDNLARYLQTVSRERDVKHVLAGDFNIDNSKHNSTRNILRNHNLMFNITSETHRDGACIDNFITNFKNSKSRVIRSKSSEFSDHSPIELVVEKEVTMIAEKEKSLFWRLVEKIFFLKKEQPKEQDDSSRKRSALKDLDNEKCKTIFYRVFDSVFCGNCKNNDSRKKTPITKSKVVFSAKESNAPQSLLSKLFNYFTSGLSVSSSQSENYSSEESKTKNAKNIKMRSVEKPDSIFTRIIRWIKDKYYLILS